MESESLVKPKADARVCFSGFNLGIRFNAKAQSREAI